MRTLHLAGVALALVASAQFATGAPLVADDAVVLRICFFRVAADPDPEALLGAAGLSATERKVVDELAQELGRSLQIHDARIMASSKDAKLSVDEKRARQARLAYQRRQAEEAFVDSLPGRLDAVVHQRVAAFCHALVGTHIVVVPQGGATGNGEAAATEAGQCGGKK